MVNAISPVFYTFRLIHRPDTCTPGVARLGCTPHTAKRAGCLTGRGGGGGEPAVRALEVLSPDWCYCKLI